MKYLKALQWRTISCTNFIVTSNAAGFEYVIRVIGYKFQLVIKDRINSSLDELCLNFYRLHDAMQFAYEHHLEHNNF